MAKSKDREISEEKKLKPKIRYFARFENYSFDVPKVDENGKRLYKKNAQGNEIYDGSGDRIPIQIRKAFTNIEGRMSKGYLSIFDFDPNDESPQNIETGKRLEKLDADQGVNVEREDHFEARVNKKAFEEKKHSAELQGKLNEIQNVLNDPEALQKRLEELTRP